MASQELVNELAEELRRADETRTAMAPIRQRMPDDGGETAYAVQRANVEYWQGKGRRVVGRKIGLTAKAVQAQLGVFQPDFGTLFAEMIFGDDEEIPADRLIQPKVEAEVALVLKRDLSAVDVTLTELLQAVDFALPAIEIVDSRIAGWDIRYNDTVADNASSGLVVLGAVPVPLAGLDLKLLPMAMTRGDETVSTGNGAACLGHPLNAALWLARKMAGFGTPLVAGDLILSGALGPMVPVRPGEHFEASIEGLGVVRAAFGEERN
ncbi:2-keto-4-pentenoate hydratase [Phyllobacterium sp. 22229]|uniref:2-keto-4-pentenoate hydratase n=1 Tax=Agrobacterium radiobacter TaxID=362 RepID=A0ABD5LKP2_AGRRD